MQHIFLGQFRNVEDDQPDDRLLPCIESQVWEEAVPDQVKEKPVLEEIGEDEEAGPDVRQLKYDDPDDPVDEEADRCQPGNMLDP